MSYGIWLEDVCARCGTRTFGDWNYTSNCAPMWRAAGCDLAGFDGKSAAECATVLREGIAALEREPERYAAMNPANGWGSYQTLLPALRQLLQLLEAHPAATVRVSR